MIKVSFYKTKTSADMKNLTSTPIEEGSIYFTQDSNEIYSDLDGQRKTYGGNQQQIDKLTPSDSLSIARTVYRGKNITDDYYNGNLRNEIAKGNFNNVRIGDYIVGKVTKTEYIVVDIDYWMNRGDVGMTKHHLVILPKKLQGVDELLWGGAISSYNPSLNVVQGRAPMNRTDTAEGGYANSYMRKTVLPKVHTNWLQKDFDNNCLKFKNILDNAISTTSPSVVMPDRKGRSKAWAWFDSYCDLPTFSNYLGFSSENGTYSNGCQSTQFSLFKVKPYWEVIGRDWTWCREVASVSLFCIVVSGGHVGFDVASSCLTVRPFALLS